MDRSTKEEANELAKSKQGLTLKIDKMKDDFETLYQTLTENTQEVTALSEKVEVLRSESKMLEINLKAKQQAVRSLSAGGQFNTNPDGKEEQNVEENMEVTNETNQGDHSMNANEVFESQENNNGNQPKALREQKTHTAGILMMSDLEQQKLNENLLKAAEEGDLEEVVKLIEEGADIESRTTDFENKAPIHLASEGGFTDIVEELLSRGANVNVSVTTNKTSLYLASWNGHSEVVQLLLSKDVELEVQDDFNQTALHAASESGYPEVVRLLLDKGANVFAKDNLNRYPMHYAAQYGHSEVVKELLSSGTPVDDIDNFEQSPLHVGAEIGSVEIIEMLFSRGTSALQNGDKWKRTPLHYAAWNGRVDAMRLLIAKGAKINPINAKGRTPLHLASEGGHVDAAEILLSHGAKVDDLKWTALHSAAEYGKTNVLPLLLPHCTKPHVDLIDENQQSPLHVALLKGFSETANFFYSQGFDIYQEDVFGQSPLLIATVLNNEDVIRCFQSQGVNSKILEKYQIGDEWDVNIQESQIIYTSVKTKATQSIHPSSMT